MKFKIFGRLALFLGAGLFVLAGLKPAAAGLVSPPFYTESGFEFFALDVDGDTVPTDVSPSGPLGAFPETGILGICVRCEDAPSDGLSNVLAIGRTDGALFSMTGFVGGSFPIGTEDDGVPEPTGPVDYEVALPFVGTSFATGELLPGLAPHAVSTDFVLGLFIFSPDPIDPITENENCLCFDSMSFLVDFGSIVPTGPQTAFTSIVPITVTFDSVPEPGTLSLLGLGLAGLAALRRRRRVPMASPAYGL